MRKIKTGDQIIVIAGRDKGRTGSVLNISADGERVLVEGINMAKRHTRPNPGKGEPGGIIERELSLHVSNVMHYNPVAKKGDRIGVRKLEDGKKVRYFKSNNEVVDV